MQRFIIINEEVRLRALDALLSASNGSAVTIRDGVGRNGDQNARFHAMLTDISRQVQWYGKTLSVEVWKRLVTAAYLREIGGHPQLIPALDGEGFDVIFERTSTMPQSRTKRMRDSDPAFNELIDWTAAFGDLNCVEWSERARDQ